MHFKKFSAASLAKALLARAGIAAVNQWPMTVMWSSLPIVPAPCVTSDAIQGGFDTGVDAIEVPKCTETTAEVLRPKLSYFFAAHSTLRK